MNVAATLCAFATREEVTSISEQWDNVQQLADARTVIKLRNDDTNQRQFQIATITQPALELSRAKDSEGVAAVQHSISRDANVNLTSIESGDERIKIEIDLGLRSMRTRADASENFKDILRISAPSFEVEAIQKTSLSVQLEHRYVQEQTQREFRVPRTHQPAELDTDAAGNERLKTFIDLIGQPHVKEEIGIIRKIINYATPISLDVDEFEEAEALLYADLKTRFPNHDEVRIVLKIARTIEPQILRTKAPTEEYSIINEDWRIPEGREESEITKWIAFRGEPARLKFRETGDEKRHVGYTFDRPITKEERQLVLKDSRFGGKIELLTKAAGLAERVLALALTRKLQNEILRQKMPYRAREEVKMRLLESTQENASINATFNTQAQIEHAIFKCECANLGEPLTKRMRESTHVFDTVNYEWARKAAELSNEMVVDIPESGGSFHLNTEAADDVKLDVLRELKRDEEFYQKEIILKYANRLPECVLRTPASTSKHVQLNDGFYRSEPHEAFNLSIKDCNRYPTLIKKMKEAGDVKQVTQIDRQRDAQLEHIERIIWLSRPGGHFRLKTDAADDISLSVLREVECSKPKHLSLEHVIVIANELSARLDSLCAGSADRYLQAQFQSPDQRERTQIIIKAMPRQILTRHFLESEHETLTYNSALKQRESKELIELTNWIPQDGGRVDLRTKASGDLNASKVYDLTKKRDTEAECEIRRICKRDAEPIMLNTPESSNNQTNFGSVLERPNEYVETDRLFDAINTYPPILFRCKQSTAIQEITNFRYSRDEAREESLIIVWERRSGGVFSLNTKHADEDIVTISRLIEKQLDNFKRAEFTIICANIGESQTLRSRGTVENATIIGCTFFHLDANERVLKSSRAANELRVEFKAKESQAVSETLNLRYQRDEESASKGVVLDEARYGGRIAYGSNASQETTTHCTSTLDGNPITDLRAPDHFITLKNVAEPLQLNTPASSIDQNTITATFSRPQSDEIHHHSRPIARTHPEKPALLTKESGSQADQLNCDLQRPASNEQFTETKWIPRFGGAFSLNARAAGDKQHLCEADLRNPRPTDLSCPYLIVIKREPDAHPRLNTIASSKDEKTVNANLQRSEAYEQTQIKLTSARTIDTKPSVRITESKEVEHMTNVQLTRPEAYANIDIIRQEARFGGAFKLDGKRTTDLITECNRDWKKEEAKENAQIVVKIPRDEEPRSLSTGHASSQEAAVSASLQSPHPNRDETAITLKTANNAEPLIHRVSEAGHDETTTNVALQSGKRTEEEAEQTRKEVRFGGTYSMSTKAAGEAMGGDTNVNLTRPEGNLTAELAVKISGEGEPKRLDVSAAGDAAIGVDSQLNRVEFADSISHVAVHRLIEKLFMNLLETSAENVSLTSTEVRRRLAEVQVEALVMRAARETSPVSLRTEFAQDTVVRIDPPTMQPPEDDPKRKQLIEHVIPEIVIEQPDEFYIDAVDKVKLRRHYSNAEKNKEKRYFL
jgi:hypothetical protein